MKCRSTFTQDAYDRACSSFDESDYENASLSKAAALVVGVHNPIALAVAIELAKKGCRLYVLSADKKKGTDALGRIVSSYPSSCSFLPKLYIHDISNIHQVKAFIEELTKDLHALSDHLSIVLFEEESVQAHWNEPTEEVPMQPDFCSHVLSLYCLLSQLIYLNLFDSSREAGKYPHARVIVIENPALLRRSLLPNNLEGSNWKKSFKSGRAYANFKRQQMELIIYFAAVHRDIHFYGVNPGLVNNSALKYLSSTTLSSMKKKCRTTEQAADGVAWAAIFPLLSSQIPSGSLILDRKVSPAYLCFCSSKPSTARRERFAQRLNQYKLKYYDEVRETPTQGSISTKSSQLIAPDSDAIYNNPELPSYSDNDANLNKKH
ncbi:hypothetical protein DI09_34p90 [Mitosporidium daphniae]|uniref:Uncharacterized protein n=1 Tax=Mitosporidium daphniae TaxID=1485682 RepID=A0A098VQZ8_9MICR|nr:uncharacterized protein DI09_34p90 [Mitosporidium daphniae]KGG51458.1 hypothetical protein DI09_34p90 [Mitosporidium daphniae]|eukprot:XP_013237912.1 uncharacterized protein DI09_34p90 [Mitosporidium daphniae]